jgi:Xaa-Pro dipeptidase
MNSKLRYFQDIIFPEEEYRLRLNKAKNLMKKNDIDCLVVSDDRMTWYFTGFGSINPIGSRARPRILLIPLNDELVYYVHRSTITCVKEMVWFDNIIGYSDLTRTPIEGLASGIRELCSPGASIGFELGQDQRLGFPVKDYLQLRDKLEGYTFVDATNIILRLRMIKTDREIQRIRQACNITSLAYDYALPKIKEGMTEQEIGLLMEKTMYSYNAMGAWTWVIVGDYERIDGISRNKKVNRGDLIFIDMGANYGGYWADFSRAGVIGGPSKKQENMQCLINGVCNIGVEALQLGNTTSQVANTIKQAMDERKLIFNSKADRYGHGMGLFTTEPPNIADYDHTMIEENMVLTVEPGMFREDGMFHLEENVLVTRDGPEVLSTPKQELTYIPV